MAGSVRPSKPWQALTEANVATVGGYVGVYELADESGQVVAIGYAGGRSPFGLAGELRARLGTAAQFRYEVTTSYWSRYAELALLHGKGDRSLGSPAE